MTPLCRGLSGPAPLARRTRAFVLSAAQWGGAARTARSECARCAAFGRGGCKARCAAAPWARISQSRNVRRGPRRRPARVYRAGPARLGNDKKSAQEGRFVQPAEPRAQPQHWKVVRRQVGKVVQIKAPCVFFFALRRPAGRPCIPRSRGPARGRRAAHGLQRRRGGAACAPDGGALPPAGRPDGREAARPVRRTPPGRRQRCGTRPPNGRPVMEGARPTEGPARSPAWQGAAAEGRRRARQPSGGGRPARPRARHPRLPGRNASRERPAAQRRPAPGAFRHGVPLVVSGLQAQGAAVVVQAGQEQRRRSTAARLAL